MKKIIIFLISFLFIAQETLFSQGIESMTPCSYDASIDPAIVAANMKTSSVTDCYGANYYTCRDAQMLLYNAEATLGKGLNNAINGDCVTCNLSGIKSLAARINGVYSNLYAKGYSRYTTGIELTASQWMDPTNYCSNKKVDPFSGPELTGKWVSDNGFSIDITKDRINEAYNLRMKDPKTYAEYNSSAQYTSNFQIYANSWRAGADIYDDKIVWSDQVWTRQSSGAKPVVPKKAAYYLIKNTGAGYARISTAHALQRDWTSYFIVYMAKGEDINDYISKWKNDAESAKQSYCSGNKSGHCPCPAWPTVWTEGPYYEVLDISDSWTEWWRERSCENSDINLRIACYEYVDITNPDRPLDWFNLPCY